MSELNVVYAMEYRRTYTLIANMNMYIKQ